MSKTLIFQKSFLISGIMCFDGCGNTIQGVLKISIDECIKQNILPKDARLIMDAEPHGLGIHQLTLSIESDQDDFIPSNDLSSILSAKIKNDILFDVIDFQETQVEKPATKKNWINMLINSLSMSLVLALTLVFPPSILLTAALTTLTCVSTAFTSRDYLYAFIQNLRTKNLANMATTISLGWFLSMAHTFFHAIKMPLASNLSMIFMNFIMPTLLITCINAMDELKRHMMEQSKKIQLNGIKTLFPQMLEHYRSYKLAPHEAEWLSDAMGKEEELPLDDLLLQTKELTKQQRTLLTEGTLIEIPPGACVPLDCILIKGHAVIDASLLTGEPHQIKKLGQAIPAGAINLGQKIMVYSVKNAYNSTVNTLLFRSNRSKHAPKTKEEVSKFIYFYTALILIGILGAILTPIALGIATVPLLLQNVMGILFSVCPCTLAIANELPRLISLHHRNKKGIQLHDEGLIEPETDSVHTVVFDKTGTLTTGNSVVESSNIPRSSSLWQRIYLLEKTYGRGHPLAQAIQKYYETSITHPLLFDEVHECSLDHNHRGLSARVQGKRMYIGNVDYLRANNIELPEPDLSKIKQGFSAVCVAEDGLYQGTIYIKHEIRSGVFEALTRLKKEGKKIIMLTGDNLISAQGFNKQMNSVFEQEDIHAGQTPQDKESFLANLMAKKGIKPKGVWFVGDGLNDAPCCRMVSEQGGVSCSMDCNDKSAFFTDITLNNSLNYLSEHKTLNKSLAQIITQNKGILIYSTLAFLAFIISFSIAGIAVSPLIPMAIMLSSTFFVLFNSYRTQLTIDTTLDQTSSWYKKLLSSNLSIGLLLTASTLLIGATLVATIATGTLALPILAFTAGAAMALSSACTLSALTLLGLFMGILTAALLASPKSIISNPVEPAKPGLLNTPERDNDGTSENRKRAAGLNFFADPQQSTPPFLDNLMNHP